MFLDEVVSAIVRDAWERKKQIIILPCCLNGKNKLLSLFLAIFFSREENKLCTESDLR